MGIPTKKKANSFKVMREEMELSQIATRIIAERF